MNTIAWDEIRHIEQDVLQARQKLEASEFMRYNPRHRDLFWDAGRWLEALTHVTAQENVRNAWYQYRIANELGTAAHLAAFKVDLYAQTQADIRWHTKIYMSLQTCAQRWQADPSLPPALLSDLAGHCYVAKHRSMKCRIQHQQFALECLESQRRDMQQLSANSWSHMWNELQVLYREQDTLYALAPKTMPRCTLNRAPITPLLACHIQRLDWYQELRRTQQETLYLWQSNPDLPELARRNLHTQRTEIENAIARLTQLYPNQTLPLDAIARQHLLLGVLT